MRENRFDDAAVASFGKVLHNVAAKSGMDVAGVFGKWMDWMLADVFGVDSIMAEPDVVRRLDACKSAAPDYSELMGLWMNASATAMDRRGWGDFFGLLYESELLTDSKAGRTGQFFTPHDVCDLMARITMPAGDIADRCTAYDPACGSGRCLLSAYGQLAAAKSPKAMVYVGGDVDALCVKMTALNMMIHGMVGIAERRNAITQEFTEAYVVNEVLSPKEPCVGFSIRRIDDEATMERARDILVSKAREHNEGLDRLAKMYDAMRAVLGMEPAGAAVTTEADGTTGAAEVSEPPMTSEKNQACQLPIIFE